MRLLLASGPDEDGVIMGEFGRGPGSPPVPEYAILSHSWGVRDGGEKIEYCLKQSKKEGSPKHFWVDTYCIDRNDDRPTSEAINSLFRYYREARVCYVHLEDVDATKRHLDDWLPLFRQSRWFQLGWALQELIAPKKVEFYSSTWEYLGDKESLETEICAITGIPASALRGQPLSGFTVADRMAWAIGRDTAVPEELAYSLLGIFDVQMTAIYGEGRGRAMRRLQDEVARDQKGTRRGRFSVPLSLYDVPESSVFVGRTDELAAMRDTLTRQRGRQSLVLHGLAGIGKTQVAIAYAKKHDDDYSAIFWIDTKDADAVSRSFTRIAKQIHRQFPRDPALNAALRGGQPQQILDAVKAWLGIVGNTEWLLIFDDCDNGRMSGPQPGFPAIEIDKYMPKTNHGSVLVTTRLRRFQIRTVLEHTPAIRLFKMKSQRECLEILAGMSRRPDAVNDADAMRLATELDGLPLALATAGAYLEASPSLEFADYFHEHKNSWYELQESSPRLSSYGDRGLLTILSSSVELAVQEHPHVQPLLKFWVYLHAHEVWLELLRYHKRGTLYGNAARWLVEMTTVEDHFNRAIQVLEEHGLVEPVGSLDGPAEQRGYGLNGCVHAWIRWYPGLRIDGDAAKTAGVCVASLVELGHITGRECGQAAAGRTRLIRHAEAWAQMLPRTQDAFEEGDMEIPYRALVNLFAAGYKLKAAERVARRILKIRQESLGHSHPSTLSILVDVGTLLWRQGKLEKVEDAKVLYEQAIAEARRNAQDGRLTADTANLRALHLLTVVSNEYYGTEASRRWIELCRPLEHASRREALPILLQRGRFHRYSFDYLKSAAVLKDALDSAVRDRPDPSLVVPIALELSEVLWESEEREQRNGRPKAMAVLVKWEETFERDLGPTNVSTLRLTAQLCGKYFGKKERQKLREGTANFISVHQRFLENCYEACKSDPESVLVIACHAAYLYGKRPKGWGNEIAAMQKLAVHACCQNPRVETILALETLPPIREDIADGTIEPEVPVADPDIIYGFEYIHTRSLLGELNIVYEFRKHKGDEAPSIWPLYEALDSTSEWKLRRRFDQLLGDKLRELKTDNLVQQQQPQYPNLGQRPPASWYKYDAFG